MLRYWFCKKHHQPKSIPCLCLLLGPYSVTWPIIARTLLKNSATQATTQLVPPVWVGVPRAVSNAITFKHYEKVQINCDQLTWMKLSNVYSHISVLAVQPVMVGTAAYPNRARIAMRCDTLIVKMLLWSSLLNRHNSPDQPATNASKRDHSDHIWRVTFRKLWSADQNGFQLVDETFAKN